MNKGRCHCDRRLIAGWVAVSLVVVELTGLNLSLTSSCTLDTKISKRGVSQAFSFRSCWFPTRPTDGCECPCPNPTLMPIAPDPTRQSGSAPESERYLGSSSSVEARDPVEARCVFKANHRLNWTAERVSGGRSSVGMANNI